MQTESIESSSPPQDHPILPTKLIAPPVRESLVERPRLLERLDRGLRATVTLVAAPPGFGKTTLLSNWAQRTGLPVAWLSLDATENDPTRFWVYVVHALRRVEPTFGADVLGLLRSPQAPPSEVLLPALVNALSELRSEIVFIIDDYQTIHSRQIHTDLAFVIQHLPRQLHLTIASRADPPLPLARLRARGELVEIRDADLRFTVEEAAALLGTTMDAPLPADDVAALAARTEGWAAGLQIAALSLRNRPDPSAFVRAFAGSNRFVFDYLLEEVLQQVSPDTETFLLETSILGRLTGDLCDAVTGRDDGQAQLERLERDHLFVTALDDRQEWYRYHSLFADVLRHRLRRLRHGYERDLHRRAAEWHTQARMIPEAVGHSLAAEDYARAAHLIERSAESMWNRGEVATLLTWLNALPAPEVESRPRLVLILAWVEFLADRFAAVEAYLQRAEATAQSDPEATDVPGVIAAIRAAMSSMRGDDPRAVIAFAEGARAALPESYAFWRRVTAIAEGLAYDALGDPASARRAFREALDDALAHRDGVLGALAVWNLLRVYGTMGDLELGIRHGKDVLDQARDQGWREVDLSYVRLGLGRLLYERNELAELAEHVEAGIATASQGGLPRPLIDGYVTLARLRQAEGDAESAREMIERAEETARRHQVSDRLARVAPDRARLALASGDLQSAVRWARETEAMLLPTADSAPRAPDAQVEHLMLARVWIAEGRPDDAVRLLARLRAPAEASGRIGDLIEILALTTVALHARGDQSQARATLARALELGVPHGFVRTFADEGQIMSRLLDEASVPASVSRHDLDRLKAACAPTGTGSHPSRPVARPATRSPLSERELEVLRFVASGASNGEIAKRLFVSLPTVKKHVANILHKLDVANRTQAAARARELGLL